MTSTPSTPTPTYPDIRPSSRNFDPGNWPVKTYNSQSGKEVRLLYGSKRYNLKLKLGYKNIADRDAAKFLAHFDQTKGTFDTFQFSTDARTALFAGWLGTAGALNPPTGVDWRYEKAPQIVAVRPGISTVNVSLIGVI